MKKNNKKYALKEMSKVRIIDRRSEKSIRGEREFLARLRHPFIVNMNCAFQDYENLYLVMDLLTGGDLRYHLCKLRRFSEDETKFFIACLLLGLEYIHNNNIIHRDIKPENLVSDDKGYIRITDFGVAKIRKEDNSSETSGTPGYMAPEVLMAQNHSFPVDFFAIGIMGYEFMMGQRPYIGKNRKEIKHLILQKQAKIDEDDIPEDWSLESVDFINRCIKRNESRRLGYNQGVAELKSHPWFKDFDWGGLYNKTISAPFVPKKAGNFDKKYCEGNEKVSDTTLERYQNYLKKPNFRNIFIGYTYINTELIQNTETLSNITTGTKSNKPLQIKTNTNNTITNNNNNDLLNKVLNNVCIGNNKKINNKTKDEINMNIKNNNLREIKEDINIVDNNTNIDDKNNNNKVLDNIKANIIENNKSNNNHNNNNDKNVKSNNLDDIKENINKENNVSQQLNYLSFSSREDKSKSKINSPTNSIIVSNKEEAKKDIFQYNNNRDNSILSLQQYLNYSKQRTNLGNKEKDKEKNKSKTLGKENHKDKNVNNSKNQLYLKAEESRNNLKEKRLNLSGLDPSSTYLFNYNNNNFSNNNYNYNNIYNNIIINNNFKKVETRNAEKKKMRSSSVCYSSNNNHESSNPKIQMNKTNYIYVNDAGCGKTIDVNKINRLYNLMNMNNKGSLSSKNRDRNSGDSHKKINYREKFSSFGTPLGSPRNLNKINLYLNKENKNNSINKLMPFYLPNLLPGTFSPSSFMNGFKLKGKLNLNLCNMNQIKLKLNKNNKTNNNNNSINNKNSNINGNNNNIKRPMNFKRNNSTSMFNQFMKGSINKKGIYQKKNMNIFENRTHFVDSKSKYHNNNSHKNKKETKKLNHRSKDINIFV